VSDASGKALPAALALAVLLSGVIASAFSDAATAPVPPQAIEAGTASASPSIEPTAADRKAEPPSAFPPQRRKFQLRLDDGKYNGFHQENNDELRSNERVVEETDKITLERRARRAGDSTYP